MSENEKPRICEMLGVEIGEEWEYPLGERTDSFRLTAVSGNRTILETIYDDDTHERWDDASGMFNSSVFIKIFTHPEKIIHKKKSCWTEEDMADAKAVRRLWPRAWSVSRDNSYTNIYESNIPSYTPRKIFPSLKPGETAKLDEILEAEND